MFQRRKSVYTRRQTTLLGFPAAGRGLGTTCFAVSAANYFSSDRKYKTAFVDFEGNSGFLDLMTEELKISEGVVGFTFQDVDYFPALEQRNLSVLKQKQYDVMILDLGYGAEQMQWESLCDLVYPTVNLKPWRIGESVCFLASLMEWWRTGGYVYCRGVLKEEEALLKQYLKNSVIKVRNIPEIRNPMRLTEQDLCFLRDVFSKV